MSATAELAARAALWWLDHKPFSKEARARRKAKRAARKAARRQPLDEVAEEFNISTEEDRTMAIDIGTRTTTNMTVSGLVVYGAMKLLSTWFPEVPTEGLEELIAAVVAYVVGYFTKTPAQPKVL